MFLLVGILFLFLTDFLTPNEELKNNLVYSNVHVIARSFQINHKGMTLLLVITVNMEELLSWQDYLSLKLLQIYASLTELNLASQV